jgi:hypothetical protein
MATFRSGVIRAALGVLGIALVGAALAASAIVLAQPAAGEDGPEVEKVVRKAIEASYRLAQLPPGLKAGQLNASDKAAMHSSARRVLSEAYAGSALTTRVNRMDVWIESIALKPGVVRNQFVDIKSIDLDTPAISGDSATVSGTYVITLKNAADLADGRTRTWGGTSKLMFVAELSRNGATWKVTAYSETQIEELADPSMSANFDDPSPLPTKADESHVPLPVNPIAP